MQLKKRYTVTARLLAMTAFYAPWNREATYAVLLGVRSASIGNADSFTQQLL